MRGLINKICCLTLLWNINFSKWIKVGQTNTYTSQNIRNILNTFLEYQPGTVFIKPVVRKCHKNNSFNVSSRSKTIFPSKPYGSLLCAAIVINEKDFFKTLISFVFRAEPRLLAYIGAHARVHPAKIFSCSNKYALTRFLLLLEIESVGILAVNWSVVSRKALGIYLRVGGSFLAVSGLPSYRPINFRFVFHFQQWLSQ